MTVYTDPLALTIPDDEHSQKEPRQKTTGRSSRDRVQLVVSVEPRELIGEIILRIISVRRATTQEVQEYADHIQQILSGEG